MQINSDFTLDNTPQVSVAMRCFVFALAREAVLHSGSFVKRKKQLKARCEYEMLNYRTLEYNLNLFFELFEDYRKTNDPVLYSFLKLQAGFCFIDEQNFRVLQIASPGQSSVGNEYVNQPAYVNSSAGQGCIVGGHLIGLD